MKLHIPLEVTASTTYRKRGNETPYSTGVTASTTYRKRGNETPYSIGGDGLHHLQKARK
jgi:hypothetical protein